MEEDSELYESHLKISMLQVLKEVTDMLNPGESLKIRDDGASGVWV